MTIFEILTKLFSNLSPIESFGSSFLFYAAVLCTIVQVAPIKINPWDFLLGWIGERFNSGINKRINEVNERVNRLEESIDKHIEKCDIDDWKRKRSDIVEFVNQGVNGARHTKESFENIIALCDEYEDYVKKNPNVHNGVINDSMYAIRIKYQEHLVKADFPEQELYIYKNKSNADL